MGWGGGEGLMETSSKSPAGKRYLSPAASAVETSLLVVSVMFTTTGCGLNPSEGNVLLGGNMHMCLLIRFSC